MEGIERNDERDVREITLCGITVKFPYEPYDVQKRYMESVINCLDNSENAILESPTGTGKTLCLLCATLAWVEHNTTKMTKPRTVIYASRTHSQIAQVAKELKRTDYKNVKATVIGSRDQLCIHPKLKGKSNAEKILKCKDFRDKHKCGYHINYALKMNSTEFRQKIMDIEDLRGAGETRSCCSYYAAKERAKRSKIILMPYNYLIDPIIRDSVLKNVELRDSIVILDEAHNVPSVCESSASTSITSKEIFIAIRDMKYMVNRVDAETYAEHDMNENEARGLKASLHKLVEAINDVELNSQDTITRSGGYIFTLLKETNITETSYQSKISLIKKMIEILFEERKAKPKKTKPRPPKGVGLNAISNFLQIVFSGCDSPLRDRIDSCFYVHIKADSERTAPKKHKTDDSEIKGTNKILHFWCFSPAFGIQNLMRKNIRSLILTSGTLSPFKPLINEMEIPMPVQLSNPHVIKGSQVYAEIVERGVKYVPINGNYENSGNKEYLDSLGESIVKVAEVVPDGLLVFFKSYGLMEKCQLYWQSNSIWNRLKDQKPIFVEPKDKRELKLIMRDYNSSIQQKTGAIFLAVLRAKVSEGLDFADMYGRAVVIVGIPYGLFVDPKVVLKKEYLDKNRTAENQLPSGDEGYRLDAVRAVNQAIGRVIRHKNDYGAILLFDEGFNQDHIKADISSWIKSELKPSTPNHPTPFNAIIENLEHFYRTAEQTLPTPEANAEPEVDDDDEPDTSQQSAELMDVDDDSDDDSYDSDSDENEENEQNDTMLVESQVTVHERKRKTSTSTSTISDAEMSDSQPNLFCDESKRTKMNSTLNLDNNMNICDESGSVSSIVKHD